MAALHAVEYQAEQLWFGRKINKSDIIFFAFMLGYLMPNPKHSGIGTYDFREIKKGNRKTQIQSTLMCTAALF